ncbi:MAG TPA: metallophosphoesterase family protein [Ferruginibacter sp.]|nr:metallophosphoesterase family protein [Ferruginibacter sp.]HMP19427.1 metallophosphoesterase family protein [Ferruginibacter sp.]
MTIALLSDIHANLPALEAAFESMDAHAPDAVYCLGDLIGYHIWPNEVVQLIRRRGIATIAGNHDVKMQKLTATDLNQVQNYAYSLVGADEKKYLLSLPAHIRLTFNFDNVQLNMLLVHGSPSSNKEYLLEDKDETEFLQVFANAGADMICFGHSHKAYHRVLQAGTGIPVCYHAINAGSVGKPKDGTPDGCYALITLDANSSPLDKDSITVQFIRFSYDVEKAATAIEASPLPNTLADMLRKGY